MTDKERVLKEVHAPLEHDWKKIPFSIRTRSGCGRGMMW